MTNNIILPFNKEKIASLKAFDVISLTGKLLVGRDQVHKKLVNLIENKLQLPVDLKNQTIFYMGPATKPSHLAIGSSGPTTSARMDSFTPQLMQEGLIATIGKGSRSEEVVASIKDNKGLYLVAYGGCGALYATKIVKQRIVAFEELGPEALLEIEVIEFPVIVAIDSCGNSIF